MNSAPTTQPDSGLLAALGAYLMWGFLPLYLIFVSSVPAFEFVGWRTIWTLPICLLIIAFRKQAGALFSALRDWRTLAWLTVSALLIGFNWLVYIWAIQQGYVFATSMGYYLNPMLNVLLGTVLLGEKLTRTQWVAVAIASLSIAALLAGALTTLWITLCLAGSFAFYGIVRKQVAVGALPGLTIESALLFLPASGIALWYAQSPAGSSFGHEIGMSLLIVLGGVLTAVPLLLFAIAAKRMPYSTLGFIQFLAPTIVFILGLTVFEEPLRPAQLVSFIFIWIAIALFVKDLWRSRQTTPSA